MTHTDKGLVFLFAGIAMVGAVVLIILNIRITGSAIAEPLADSATVSTTAPLADSATVSTTAPLADSATVSTTAPLADSATVSTTAPLADSATVSTTAPLADSATVSTTAKIMSPLLLPPANSVNADPKGVSDFKIFILTQDTLESEVNKWFAVQRNIVVDQLSVGDYGGGAYLIVIGYHTGGAGKSSTRLELIDGENSEAEAQAFVSSLGPSKTVRSVAAIAGSYSGSETTVTIPIVFIIYE